MSPKERRKIKLAKYRELGETKLKLKISLTTFARNQFRFARIGQVLLRQGHCILAASVLLLLDNNAWMPYCVIDPPAILVSQTAAMTCCQHGP